MLSVESTQAGLEHIACYPTRLGCPRMHRALATPAIMRVVKMRLNVACAKMTNFWNFLLYQFGWFACVLGLAWDLQWLGATIALCLVGIHFWLATDRAVQVKLVCLAAGVGLIVDCLQLQIGVFSFPRGALRDWLPPASIVVLWIQFATTFRYSMRWLSGRYWLCTIFGLVGAPLAFFAGERLGAIEFLSPRLLNFAILGVLWSIAVPLLINLSDHLASRVAIAPQYRWISESGVRLS